MSDDPQRVALGGKKERNLQDRKMAIDLMEDHREAQPAFSRPLAAKPCTLFVDLALR